MVGKDVYKRQYENTNIPVSGITVTGTEATGYTLTIVLMKFSKRPIEKEQEKISEWLKRCV